MRWLIKANHSRLRKAIKWLWSHNGSPAHRARGVSAGIFCGCFPFFGLQIFLSFIAAYLVRGNQLLAAAGTLVSNPFTYIPLYWLNYIVGNSLLGPSPETKDLNKLDIHTFWIQGWDFTNRMLLGSSLVGSIMAISLGLISYKFFRKKDSQSSNKTTVSNHA